LERSWIIEEGRRGYNNFRVAALKPTIKDPRHKNLEGLKTDDHDGKVEIRITKPTNSASCV
jgi:hypothetical protein